jgi:hypothetical protein
MASFGLVQREIENLNRQQLAFRAIAMALPPQQRLTSELRLVTTYS